MTNKKDSIGAGSSGMPPRSLPESDFATVLSWIDSAHARTVRIVNQTLIELYWTIGEFLSGRIAEGTWGKGTVQSLAAHISVSLPGVRGFSASNLWRTKQFFETYRDAPKLAPLVREISWSHNLVVLGRCKRGEEREFYLQMCRREHWTKRELERQITGALFERSVLQPPILAPAVRELEHNASAVFKDSYLVEFLQLAPAHSEADLEKALLRRLKQFLIELGRDFCFIGNQYPLQVGGRDFALDLLFFHRGMNCLVAIELKIDEFQPEHLGKLEFYLEALDRDVKKPHEHPSIGVLLCKTKDNEVVEYALSRAMSPALVAEYQIHLPDKRLLEAKLHEFYELAELQAETESSLLDDEGTDIV